MSHNSLTNMTFPPSSPQTHMYQTGLQAGHDLQGLLKNENASLHAQKLIRISRWQQQCIQWYEESFWAQCPKQLHRSPAHESWSQGRSFEKIILPLKDIKPFRLYFSILRFSLQWDGIHTWDRARGCKNEQPSPQAIFQLLPQPSLSPSPDQERCAQA